MSLNYTIQIAGENSLIIYFSAEMNPDISRLLLSVKQQITATFTHEIIDIIVSYGSILVVYNQRVTDHFSLCSNLKALLVSVEANIEQKGELNSATINTQSTIELPVYYSTESGPDLLAIAERCDIAPNDVIKLHHQQKYKVYAIGFAPGFAYLGQVNEKIATPRKSTPRLKVPKGAVGIADQQTAIYPSTSPGGWNIIGNCPISMFDALSEPSMPVQVGDTVTFTPINKAEFIALGGKLDE